MNSAIPGVPIHLRNLPPPDECFDHASFITSLAAWLKPRVYLELGVRDGHTIRKVLPFAQRAIGVDIRKDPSLNAFPIEFYEMTTDAFFERARNSGLVVDMALIDADHRHESSLRDFDNLLPFVAQDGFIFLHDTYPINERYTQPNLCGDSWRTAHYVRSHYGRKCEIVTLPIQPGLSIVRKSDCQLAWLPESVF